MIVLVTTHTHRYTHRFVQKAYDRLRIMGYPELMARRRLPKATYIFADFDRLNSWQRELAAHLYKQLGASGCRTLNDPARYLGRLTMIRRLHRDGVHDFTAWPAAEADLVDRYPVFLRTIAAHRGNLSDLIEDGDSLRASIDRYCDEGHVIENMMISEYCAEPLHGDVYRKLAVYRIGDRLVTSPSAHETHWTAKYGTLGAAGAAGYAEDLRIMRENPYADAIWAAFRTANVEYGRADYGVVGGRAQIYEINTNPMRRGFADHPFPDRMIAFDESEAHYFEALAAIDMEGGGTIKVEAAPLLREQAPHKRLLPGYQWMP